MSLIMIQPQRVQEEAGDVAAYATLLQSVAQRLNQLLRSITPEIMARRGLYSRMQAAVRQLQDIEARLRTLQGFLGTSAVCYERAENRLLLQAERIGTGGAVVPGCPSADGGLPQRRPLSDLTQGISGVASYFNDGLSKGDIALASIRLAARLAALPYLEARYVGGRPTLLQKIKGKYKFTVAAHTSWTSKSKYSSSVARALYEFSKSTPSNRWLGMLKSYAASFNGPAAMLKYAAGFSKNVNAATYGSTLFTQSTSRASKGMLEVLGSVASNKGRGAGRFIPYAGVVISFVDHTTKEILTPGRSNGEKVGRVLAGTASDVGAMWAGAKVGAAIGTLGGPVGIVIGGAAGALVGAAASYKFSDEIKQAGGKIGSAIEETAKKGISAVNKSLKSVAAWFN